MTDRQENLRGLKKILGPNSRTRKVDRECRQRGTMGGNRGTNTHKGDGWRRGDTERQRGGNPGVHSPYRSYATANKRPMSLVSAQSTRTTVTSGVPNFEKESWTKGNHRRWSLFRPHNSTPSLESSRNRPDAASPRVLPVSSPDPFPRRRTPTDPRDSTRDFPTRVDERSRREWSDPVGGTG